MARTLEELISYLDNLQQGADLDQLTAHLAELQIDTNQLAPYIHFSDQHYRRNLVRAGKWYHLWVLCWKNGQRSPIHDHRGSSCGVRVLKGTATETKFTLAPNGLIKPTQSQDCPTGSVIGSFDNDIHQMSNLEAGDQELITLHVYSQPAVRMETYSLTDPSIGEEVWIEDRKMITSVPENSETPLENIHSWVTPNKLFFVRNHFPVPDMDRQSWRLQVAGCVERPVEWSYEELTALPSRSVFSLVECAGNGRSFLQPAMPGVQWGAGAVGQGEWTGVPLHIVLEKSGVKPEAVEIMFEGADRGNESDHPEPMNFARGLPLAKALDPNTLLVYRMNGEVLESIHGYPLRLFVPGWYGVASVKWLQRIEVLDKPFTGYYQTKKYTVKRRTPHGTETLIVGPMAVKSEIIRPQPGSNLGIGMNRIFGAAWAGEEAVESVRVSTNGGQNWTTAKLLGSSVPYSWVLWEYLWEVAESGDYQLMSQATSTDGRVQPAKHDPLNGGYEIHFSRGVPVKVEATRRTEVTPTRLDALLYDMNAYAEENSRARLDVEMEFAGGEGI